MKRRLSFSALDAKLDRVFSIWVRRRHADVGGTCSCVTCGTLKFWKDMHAGHFIKRQHRSTRWRPTNVHPQCPRCNRWMGGQQDEYGHFIIQTYGLAEYQDLMAAKHQVCKFTRADLDEMIAKYQSAVAAFDLPKAA